MIVDDDIRNIFSLTSVLESHDVEVLHAERGKDGILILEQTPDVDVALIDIMMPEMDGYETMRQIRSRDELTDLPLEHGQVVRVRCYGTRNVRGDPLTPQSIMYGASLTKAVFAYTVMRLADEGKVAQDEPIAAMLSKPLPDYGNLDKYGNWGDLAGDSRWRKLTPRILLSHAGGFANFSFLEPDQKLRFHFEPGGRYAYSGEGLILLQFAIEQRLGHGFEEDAQRLAFRPLGMTDSSLHWQDRFAGRLADGWQVDGTAILHDRRDNVRVAGSMDTTIADMAKFASALVTGLA
ncbi:serine hydrolase [Sphingomonas daechungensis]|uniref:serine hydrolase n=1 Tax=Sphingomonas daechungensis TaxID=1176646 RepID=UPI0021D53AE1|nr:serine hydrolase [Sphingomonas daechungensis]